MTVVMNTAGLSRSIRLLQYSNLLIVRYFNHVSIYIGSNVNKEKTIMIARPKEKCWFTVVDDVTKCSYKVALDPNQKWNVVSNGTIYTLNKGKSGRLSLADRMFNVYFNLEDE